MKKSELRELIREQVKSLLKEADANSFELAYPGTYIAKWTVSDTLSDSNTVAKKFDFTIKVEHPGSIISGTNLLLPFQMILEEFIV